MEKETRTPKNDYVLNKTKGGKCCMEQINECWLWHRIMDHMNFYNLVNISKNIVCKHCQHGKKRVSFKTKECST